jgi:FHS family L-fucose permease-like MFS transporter
MSCYPIYPIFNSKVISCFPKHEHGTVAGVILFFTCAGATARPLIMSIVSDANGDDTKYDFMVATILFIGLLLHYIFISNR